MKKVELLAPAGSYEAFLGAIHAGADAVYLGGQKFGARAYAENFSEEEVCKAIRYAHLYGRKVYLTLNTLMKDNEMQELFDYLEPYDKTGLDGVIVQDMGVFSFVKKHFPKLELHVSTQMTITGVYGAKLMKELGAVRIVPARELSLDEIRAIKAQVDIEIETFIHGAMCYCYSGQCLFSSLLGGRSGNRGRCAQPCRLPYQTVIDGEVIGAKDTGNRHKNKKKNEPDEQYPLSLKDMCTIQMIPKLIEAGIDSFKIEGRMKKPEYAAGVTALYRKYIDMYYENPKAECHISEKDFKQLKTLYMRSDLQDGYYDRHNGAEMITPHKPSYVGCDDALLAQIRATYIEKKPMLPITGVVMLKEGLPARLTVRRQNTEIVVTGNVVETAQKQPLDEASVEKQIQKTGNTPFVFSDLKIMMDDAVFMPLKALNELRREALEQLEEALITTYRDIEADELKHITHDASVCRFGEDVNAEKQRTENDTAMLTAEVTTLEQLQVVCNLEEMTKVYIPTDLLFDHDAVNNVLTAYYKCGMATDCNKTVRRPMLCLAMPHILRKRSQSYLEELKQKLQEYEIESILVRNLESWQWLREIDWDKAVLFDANLYTWNAESKQFFAEQGVKLTAPLELNGKEQRRLGIQGMEVVVYGRLPMMITANCIRKTKGKCNGKKQQGRSTLLVDRYQKEFPVLTCCQHCYNIIYNSVPLSLHQYMGDIGKERPDSMRLLFTTESAEETAEVVRYFNRCKAGLTDNPPYREYTNGHYRRGVE